MKVGLDNNSGASHGWTIVAWWHLLNLARRYGWQPTAAAGSNYFTKGKSIAAADAAALASALESFFNDVCRDEIAGEVAERMREVLDDNARRVNPQRFDVFTEPVELVRSMKPAERTIPTWNFDEQNRAKLQGFIAFCRKGPFKIE